MSDIINTSYARDYVVLSASKSEVILRPIEESSLPTYWKEFIKANFEEGTVPEDAIPLVRLTQLPAEVLCVDAYVEYVVEYPTVEVIVAGKTIDVSDRLGCNHPNPETPGLYALDFTLSVGGDVTTPIWRSYVSIDEPPILRHIITPWNRENRAIADLNRLVIEPQFMEALYEAGVPLYNFQQANAPAAVSQFAVMGYRDARAFVKEGRLFITGPQLPVGTEVIVNGVRRTLGVKVMTTPFRQSSGYVAGDTVSYGGHDYYAVRDIPLIDLYESDDAKKGSVIPDTPYVENGTTVSCWLRGIYYIVDDMGMPDGEYNLDALWSIVDVGGYLFKMDLLRAFPVHHYWGIYKSKYFYDYAPGDLVAIVSDNVISLYQRNDTTIAEKGLEEAYRPGHYRNPHWTEVYSASNSTMLRDPAIKPYANASNAVVSKTYPVREEAFRIYAKMVGMPVELVNALGTKYSVLLWALLYRTRETFPGFRAALRAMGMDAADLHREHPSVLYSTYNHGAEVGIGNVYDEIAKVKQIAMAVKADKIWYGEGDPDLSTSDMRNVKNKDIYWIRYSREGEDPKDTVWRYDLTTNNWEPFYSFKHIGSDKDPSTYDFSVNNRYYRATVNLLDRLAADCAFNDENGKQWIDHNHVGAISDALVNLLAYEIPIYIYFRLRMSLIAIGHATMRGDGNGVVLQSAWGGFIGLKLFPGKYFDFISVSIKSYYPTLYYSYEYLDASDEGWIEYTDFYQDDERGFRYFGFDQAVYILLKFEPTANGIEFEEADDGKWISLYTIGCLGNGGSPGTNDYAALPGDHGFEGFMDATWLGAGVPLYLCKGFVAATMRIAPTNLDVSAEALQWQYIFDLPIDDPDYWEMDEIKKFADWKSVGVDLFGYWSGSVEDFKNALANCTAPDCAVSYRWDDDEPATLYIGGGSPRTVYLWDDRGYIIGMLQFAYNPNMVTDGMEADWLLKVTFEA